MREVAFAVEQNVIFYGWRCVALLYKRVTPP
jgi:hypothetical protein